MCNKRNSRLAEITPKKYVKVDGCLSYIISNLNVLGIKTLSSCCGHNKYPMTIIVKTELGNLELFSGFNINRKKRFYIKDKQGFYFIPEVINGRLSNRKRI